MFMCPRELVHWLPFNWTGPSGTDSQGQARAECEGCGLGMGKPVFASQLYH